MYAQNFLSKFSEVSKKMYFRNREHMLRGACLAEETSFVEEKGCASVYPSPQNFKKERWTVDTC